MVLGLGDLAVAVALWRRGPVDDPLRWSDPLGWLRATTAENAIVEVGRVVVLVVVGWMVCATALAIAARVLDVVSGTRRCFAVVSRVIPSFIVTMVAAAIVTTAPVLAQPRSPVAPLGPVRDGRAPTTAVTVPSPAPAAPAPVAPPVAAPPAITLPPSAAAAPSVHVVIAGESMWSIARDRAGTDAPALERYWRALCDANRAALPSRDVNLIHPGETVVLPG
jgi:nucleoid-associated protein YgaU